MRLDTLSHFHSAKTMLAAVLDKLNDDRQETNIKDNSLRKKLEILMNNTCIQKLDKDNYVFYRHYASKKKGIIYQLLLSTDRRFDGIYEFKVFGHDVQFKNIVNELGVGIRIDTLSNFNLAEFDVQDITTIITKENDVEFKLNINKFLQKQLNYNLVTFVMNNGDKIEINQNALGEIKYRKQIRTIIKTQYNDLVQIICLEKKKKHSISVIDLGKNEFKKEILELGLISKEDFELYTSFNDKLYNESYTDFKNVEII